LFTLESPELTLSLRAHEPFLQVVTSFVEHSAGALGLAQPEALALTLAAEEVFAYVCQVGGTGREVRISCNTGGYFVRAVLGFQASDFPVAAFNITAAPSFEAPEKARETGLLIASRMVDGFKFSAHGTEFRLTLIKEKAYPEASQQELPPPEPLDAYTIRAPEPEELKILSGLVARDYDAASYPLSFAYPGMLLDMARADQCRAVIAVDDAGNMGGGLIWRWDSERTAECFGPYLFGQGSGEPMARRLLDTCLESLARSRAVGLINRHPTPELPRQYFEMLGTLRFPVPGNGVADITAYYRHLGEDQGRTVWGHSRIHDFLAREYERLVFARDIRQVSQEGEWESPQSALAVEFNRNSSQATVRPVWWGQDAAGNLVRHVHTLRAERIPCILFELDLGRSWHAHFVPAALDAGFVPRFVVPYAGRADLVVFQLMEGENSA
jgi:hypothetical protein